MRLSKHHLTNFCFCYFHISDIDECKGSNPCMSSLANPTTWQFGFGTTCENLAGGYTCYSNKTGFTCQYYSSITDALCYFPPKTRWPLRINRPFPIETILFGTYALLYILSMVHLNFAM